MSTDPNTGESIAVYWKNGQEVVLAKGPTFTQALAIAVSGSDVYVAGENSNRKVYWKNGQEINLTDCAEISSMVVSKGNGNVPNSTLNNVSMNSTSDLILKEEADQYLAEMRKVPGMIETKSGLLYQVLKEGTGRKVSATDRVDVNNLISFPGGKKINHYVGGRHYISVENYNRQKGMQEAILLLREGGKYRFIIPYNLADGKTGSGDIPPYQVWIRDVEVYEIEK